MLDENAIAQDAEHSSPVLANGQKREPLAIIGFGCHFPGGAISPQAFWDLLTAGTDATRELPADRWDVRKFYDPDPLKSGKMYTSHGGYLERIDQFDAQFFGIAPREAMWLDPQQRLLLQVTWEAIEDAGLPAEDLIGSDTGVFMGGFTLDYQLTQNFGPLSRYELQAHSATGMMMTMLANRISYIFGFHGPSMSIDTACSSSLVALHLACQSIWNGECSLALAGGVNAMMAPAMTIAESKSGFLSPDGRCKTFDAAANGYARGEGAGVVLIKPFARAQADGDPIYALIRGTAVTQDGHTNGITVPNQAAQEEAMRLAYQRADVSPGQIQYVEAHGTGTPVGDPIEARAIGKVLSQGRPTDERCIVGSVKTNIGHLEAAAGVAGLMKAALSLQHRQIPPHLHFQQASPDIPFDELQLRVPVTLEDWPKTAGPRYAGINSFGFGGTNAHVVLQEAPPVALRETPTEERLYLLPLSARSGEALQDAARSFRDFLAHSPAHLYDIGYSAALRRSHHDHRLALVARSKEEAIAHLDAFLSNEARVGTSVGRAASNTPAKVAFVCSGMGPQWWAMGRDLLAHEPVFRHSIERTAAELAQYTSWSLLEAFSVSEEEACMENAEIAEPANFAIQVALAELWRSWGIHPAAIVGHSTGEFAAHYLAGSLSFQDAVRLVYHHSRLMQRLSGTGRMLAVGMSYEAASKAELNSARYASVAAINGPDAVTFAGRSEVLEEIAHQFEAFGVFHRFLTVSIPYHSEFVDPLRDELLSALADLRPQSASLPLYSTVTGTRIDGRGCDAHYWWQNARATVLFSAALTQMIQEDYTTFVELSPHPVLSGFINELLAEQEQTGTVLPSLRREQEDRSVMLGSLGALSTIGGSVAWRTLYDQPGNFVRLPTYPWQFKTYWTESAESREDRLFFPVHPLLGQRVRAASPTWELEVNQRQLPYLADHRIQDKILLPGAAFAEMALAAAQDVFGEGGYLVEELTFHKALFLTGSVDVRLQTVFRPQQAVVEIYSYAPAGDVHWTLHASARLRELQPAPSVTSVNLDAVMRCCTAEVSREEFYTQSQQMGFQYGPMFQAIEHVDTGEGLALGHIRVPVALEEDLEAYAFHPALIDAAFQVLLTAARSLGAENETPGSSQMAPYLPVGVERIRVFSHPVSQMFASARIHQADDRLVVGSLQVADGDGRLLVEIEGFRAQSLSASTNLTAERLDRGLYEMEWQLQERAEGGAMLTAHTDGEEEDQSSEGTEAVTERIDSAEPALSGSWLIFTDQSGVGQALVQQIEAGGGSSVVVSHADTPQLREQQGQYALNPACPEQFQHLFATLVDRAPFSHVVHLWSLDSTFDEASSLADLERAQIAGSQAIVFFIQALSQSNWPQLPRLWLVTRGAQAVGAHPGPIAVEQAPVWGLGRVIGHQEFASMWGGLIDLDATGAEEQATLLLNEIVHTNGEDQVAFRDSQRYVVRLVPSQHLTPALPVSFRPDSSYLITGGLGTLGLLVARWMATQGARRLILMGRTHLPLRSVWRQLEDDHPQKALIQAIQELEKLGASVYLATVDAADEEQLATFLAEYEREGWPPIRGVIHTAGVVQDELLLRMKVETFQRVLRPKVNGGWLLHKLLKQYPLDFFVLFSSTGSVIASLGQGNYAAGNAFLDALAHHRHALGLPALSIGWGPWSVGMVQQLKLEQFYTQRGIELITPEIGMQILARVLGQCPAHLTAITANWALARETAPVGTLPPMFALLGEQNGEESDAMIHDAGAFLQQLSETPAAERSSLVVTHLKELVARVLQMDGAQLNPQESLTSLGLDSMMAIEIKHRIEASLKVDVSVLELLQEITIARLAVRVLASLRLEEETATEEVESSMTEIQQLLDLADSADLEKLLAELEQPSENDELELLLAELESSLDSEAAM